MEMTQIERNQEQPTLVDEKTQELRQNDYFEDVANYIIVNADKAQEEPTALLMEPSNQEWNKQNNQEWNKQNNQEWKKQNNQEWNKQNDQEWKEQNDQEWNYVPLAKKPCQALKQDIDNCDKYKWRPGFCLQLGSQGRKAMLQLLRNVYKGDKRHKRILENMDPPTTISNLPFFKVSMLWELAYHLDVFEEALAIHKIYGKMKNKVYRNQQHGSRPYYDYDVQRAPVTRNTKPRGVPNSLYGSDYDTGKIDEHRTSGTLQRKNVDQLKRNMECLIAVKKTGPEQFIKFMSSFKNRDNNCTSAPPATNKEPEQSNQGQGNRHYEYVSQMNPQMYPCNIVDCGISPR